MKGGSNQSFTNDLFTPPSNLLSQERLEVAGNRTRRNRTLLFTTTTKTLCGLCRHDIASGGLARIVSAGLSKTP